MNIRKTFTSSLVIVMATALVAILYSALDYSSTFARSTVDSMASTTEPTLGATVNHQWLSVREVQSETIKAPWDVAPEIDEDVVSAAAPVDDKPVLSQGSVVSPEALERLLLPVSDKPTSGANAATVAAGPTIDIWYGDNQEFGHIGQPLQWVNILGNITSTNGIDSLIYSLNDGPAFPLSMGPDTKRLARVGDFNVEIAYADLLSGANLVVITGTDTLANQTVHTVTVDFDAGNVWPENFTVDWATATKIQETAQVIDGKWGLQGTFLRPLELAYDRLVAIGDITWTDYEVEVPVTIHSIDPAGFNSPSNGPGIGLIFRWQGHFNEAGEQPNTGWQNFGAIGWFRWSMEQGGQVLAGLQMYGTGGSEIAVNPSKQAEAGATYIMKMSVQTAAGKPPFYRYKVWKSNEAEPIAWDMKGFGISNGPTMGSPLLVAHHVDASFGDVVIRPLSSIAPKLSVQSGSNGTVSVTPGQSPYDYGETISVAALGATGFKLDKWSGDASGSANPLVFDLTQDTAITATFVAAPPPTLTKVNPLSGSIVISPEKSTYLYGEKLTLIAVPKPGFMFANWAGDLVGKSNPFVVTLSDDLTINAEFVPAAAPLSDDFNRCEIDDTLWTFEDPVGDVTLSTTGKRILFTVPGGSDHDLWDNKNFAPRLMQAAEDIDFTVEAKFESALSQQYQIQGILVEQDQENILRFEFYSDGTDSKILGASIISGTGQVLINQVIVPSGADMYLQIERLGDQWTERYSFDGLNWMIAGVFTKAITVNRVGLHAGNAGALPAHTAIVDYFFNTAAPILPEDARSYALNTTAVGPGSVSVEPDQGSYSCGDQITVTATPNVSAKFVEWSGALSGQTTPVSFTYEMGSVITATFTQDEQTFTLGVNAVNGSVAVAPVKDTYLAGEKVTLTPTPAEGWRFTGWSGDASGSANPLEFTMTKNATITALFEPTSLQLFLPIVTKGQ